MIKILGTYQGIVYFYDPDKKRRLSARLTKKGTFLYKNFQYKVNSENEVKEKEKKERQRKLF